MRKYKGVTVLQVYAERELHKVLGQSCLDNDMKNTTEVRMLLTSFSE